MYLALTPEPMISIAASPRAQSGVCRGRNGGRLGWDEATVCSVVTNSRLYGCSAGWALVVQEWGGAGPAFGKARPSIVALKSTRPIGDAIT